MTLLELYGCKSYEELHDKIEKNNPEVSELKEFIDHMGKARVDNRRSITSLGPMVDYLEMAKIDKEKNHLILFDSSMKILSVKELKGENLEREAFIAGIEEGKTRGVMLVNREGTPDYTAHDRKANLEEVLSLGDMMVYDVLTPEHRNGVDGYSSVLQKDFRAFQNFRGIEDRKDEMLEYYSEDGSQKDKIKDNRVYQMISEDQETKESFQKLMKKNLESQSYDPENLNKLVNTLRMSIGAENKEIFKLVMMNENNEIIATKDISQGTVHRSAIYPYEVMKEVHANPETKSVIFAHNHPSGNVKPSDSDREVTEKLRGGLQILGVKTLDHLIISRNGVVSLADEGIVKFDKYEEKTREFENRKTEPERMESQNIAVQDLLNKNHSSYHHGLDSSLEAKIGDRGVVELRNGSAAYEIIGDESKNTMMLAVPWRTELEMEGKFERFSANIVKYELDQEDDFKRILHKDVAIIKDYDEFGGEKYVLDIFGDSDIEKTLGTSKEVIEILREHDIPKEVIKEFGAFAIDTALDTETVKNRVEVNSDQTKMTIESSVGVSFYKEVIIENLGSEPLTGQQVYRMNMDDTGEKKIGLYDDKGIVKVLEDNLFPNNAVQAFERFHLQTAKEVPLDMKKEQELELIRIERQDFEVKHVLDERESLLYSVEATKKILSSPELGDSRVIETDAGKSKYKIIGMDEDSPQLSVPLEIIRTEKDGTPEFLATSNTFDSDEKEITLQQSTTLQIIKVGENEYGQEYNVTMNKDDVEYKLEKVDFLEIEKVIIEYNLPKEIVESFREFNLQLSEEMKLMKVLPRESSVEDNEKSRLEKQNLEIQKLVEDNYRKSESYNLKSHLTDPKIGDKAEIETEVKIVKYEITADVGKYEHNLNNPTGEPQLRILYEIGKENSKLDNQGHFIQKEEKISDQADEFVAKIYPREDLWDSGDTIRVSEKTVDGKSKFEVRMYGNANHDTYRNYSHNGEVESLPEVQKFIEKTREIFDVPTVVPKEVFEALEDRFSKEKKVEISKEMNAGMERFVATISTDEFEKNIIIDRVGIDGKEWYRIDLEDRDAEYKDNSKDLISLLEKEGFTKEIVKEFGEFHLEASKNPVMDIKDIEFEKDKLERPQYYEEQRLEKQKSEIESLLENTEFTILDSREVQKYLTDPKMGDTGEIEARTGVVGYEINGILNEHEESGYDKGLQFEVKYEISKEKEILDDLSNVESKRFEATIYNLAEDSEIPTNEYTNITVDKVEKDGKETYEVFVGRSYMDGEYEENIIPLDKKGIESFEELRSELIMGTPVEIPNKVLETLDDRFSKDIEVKIEKIKQSEQQIQGSLFGDTTKEVQTIEKEIEKEESSNKHFHTEFTFGISTKEIEVFKSEKDGMVSYDVNIIAFGDWEVEKVNTPQEVIGILKTYSAPESEVERFKTEFKSEIEKEEKGKSSEKTIITGVAGNQGISIEKTTENDVDKYTVATDGKTKEVGSPKEVVEFFKDNIKDSEKERLEKQNLEVQKAINLTLNPNPNFIQNTERLSAPKLWDRGTVDLKDGIATYEILGRQGEQKGMQLAIPLRIVKEVGKNYQSFDVKLQTYKEKEIPKKDGLKLGFFEKDELTSMVITRSMENGKENYHIDLTGNINLAKEVESPKEVLDILKEKELPKEVVEEFSKFSAEKFITEEQRLENQSKEISEMIKEEHNPIKIIFEPETVKEALSNPRDQDTGVIEHNGSEYKYRVSDYSRNQDKPHVVFDWQQEKTVENENGRTFKAYHNQAGHEKDISVKRTTENGIDKYSVEIENVLFPIHSQKKEVDNPKEVIELLQGTGVYKDLVNNFKNDFSSEITKEEEKSIASVESKVEKTIEKQDEIVTPKEETSKEQEKDEKYTKPDAFVEHVIASLEKGKIPWEKDWSTSQAPYNSVTEKPYTGKNNLILNVMGDDKGYTDPRWMTYNQAKEKGWQVKKGEKSVPLKYVYQVDKTTGKPVDTEMLKKLSPQDRMDYQRNLRTVIKDFNVFNAQQISGIPPLEKTVREVDFSKIDKILENSNIEINYRGDRAVYNSGKDTITLPEKSQFKSENGFYATALHELAHSTGHPLRENRDMSGKFGSPSYAKEELRAELASVFIGQEKGLSYSERHLENSTEYLKGWISVLKSDPNELHKAASDALKISKTVLGYENQKQPTLEVLKEKSKTVGIER